jgi:hypothetical protein
LGCNHTIKRQVGHHELVILPSKLLEHCVRHQVDDSTAIDEHPGDRLPINVAPNVQSLQETGIHLSIKIDEYTF